jgi:hypothetical protein
MAGDVTIDDQVVVDGACTIALPRSEAWRTQLLDATILAAVVVARGAMPVHPAARMVLLVETRRCGLVGSPPALDVRSRFDTWLRLTADPRSARRLLARHMDPFVGTPWATLIVRIADAIARTSIRDEDQPLEAATLVALRGLRTSLGVCWTSLCPQAV